MTRDPVVAGRFYRGTKAGLTAEIEGCLKDAVSGKKDVLGAVSPHAGYMYSGKAAGQTLSLIAPVDTMLILGPNHTGLGAAVSLMSEGGWKTPLGELKIDEGFAHALLSESRLFESESLAHLQEHSIEVQLPFLQYLKTCRSFVPVCIASHDVAELAEIGAASARAVSASGKKICILASSDMTHYESAAMAKKKDSLAIRKVLDLDAPGLIKTLKEHEITMCGGAPAAAMIFAVKALGAKKAELVVYTNSGEASGDLDQVVGYAGIIVQ